MTTAAIRKQLMTYLADANDEKIKALYTLLANDMKEEHSFGLTGDQLSILEERRESYTTGKAKGRGWKEVHEDIRSKRKKA
jgi:hypothetical protein